MAGGGAPSEPEPRLAVCRQVGEAERVAVDRDVVVWRRGDGGRHVRRQNPAERLAERYRLHLGHRLDPRFEDLQGLGEGHQLAAEGEAIVAELGHATRLSGQ